MTTLPAPKETRLKAEAEARAGKRLPEALPELLNARGPKATARFLGIAPGTLNYWLLQYGIQYRYVAVPKGYKLILVPENWQLPKSGIKET